MTSIVLVEFRPGWLEIRRELLESLGHPIISIEGLWAAKRIDCHRSANSAKVIATAAQVKSPSRLLDRQRCTSILAFGNFQVESSALTVDQDCPRVEQLLSRAIVRRKAPHCANGQKELHRFRH